MKNRFLITLVLLAGCVRPAGAETAPVAPAPLTIALSGPGRFSSERTGEAPVRSVVEPSAQVLPVHVFGGGSLTFEVAVDAPLGTHLRVFADFDQIATGGLAAPLQKNVPLGAELVFDQCTHQVAICELPGLVEVQRPTRAQLTVRTEPAGTGLAVPVYLYPRESPAGWRKTIATLLARSGLRRLAIFGEGQGVRRFLRERQVPFDDLGADWPGSPDPRTLYLGETATAAPPRLDDAPGLRLALFSTRADSPLLPGVFQNAAANGGSVWKVALPGLLDHLSADPRAQQTLAEIFRRALPSGSTAAPTEHDP